MGRKGGVLVKYLDVILCLVIVAALFKPAGFGKKIAEAVLAYETHLSANIEAGEQ